MIKKYNEITDQMLQNAYEVDVNGSLQKYKSIVCKKEITTEKLMPLIYQPITLGLNYRSKNSEINRYEILIKNIRMDRCTLE